MKFELSSPYDDEPRTLRFGPLRMRWPFPIASGMGGSGARVFGRPIYSGNPPFWLRPTADVFRWGYHTKWKLLHRFDPRHRYHIIKTDLEPNYWDVDTLMLHGVMALVVRYVEGERGGEAKLEAWGKELIDPANADPNAEGMDELSQGQQELAVLAIYRWWKHERPADQKRHDELMEAIYGGGRSPISWEPSDHPKLSRMVVREPEGEEITQREEMQALDEKIAADEQKWLHRAIDLRRSMWT